MKRVCKYCGAKASEGICPYCKEKVEIIKRIKLMLGVDANE